MTNSNSFNNPSVRSEPFLMPSFLADPQGNNDSNASAVGPHHRSKFKGSRLQRVARRMDRIKEQSIKPDTKEYSTRRPATDQPFSAHSSAIPFATNANVANPFATNPFVTNPFSANPVISNPATSNSFSFAAPTAPQNYFANHTVVQRPLNWYVPHVIMLAHRFKVAKEQNSKQAFFDIANEIASMSPMLLDETLKCYPSMLKLFQDVAESLLPLIPDLNLSEQVLVQLTNFSLLAQMPRLFFELIDTASKGALSYTYPALKSLLNAPVPHAQKESYYKEYLMAVTNTKTVCPELHGVLPVMSPKMLLELQNRGVLSLLAQAKDNVIMLLDGKEEIQNYCKSYQYQPQVNQIAVKNIAQQDLNDLLRLCPHIEKITLLPESYEKHRMIDLKGHLDRASKIVEVFPDKQIFVASKSFIVSLASLDICDRFLSKQLPKFLGPMHVRIDQQQKKSASLQSLFQVMGKMGYVNMRHDTCGDETILTLT